MNTRARTNRRTSNVSIEPVGRFDAEIIFTYLMFTALRWYNKHMPIESSPTRKHMNTCSRRSTDVLVAQCANVNKNTYKYMHMDT